MKGREDVAAPNHKMTRQGLQEQPILPALVRLAAPNVVSTLAQTAVGVAAAGGNVRHQNSNRTPK